jgi:hypothetical protein
MNYGNSLVWARALEPARKAIAKLPAKKSQRLINDAAIQFEINLSVFGRYL